MHPIEEQIISLIEKKSYISLGCRDQLYAFPLGKLSQEFYEDPRVKEYCTEDHDQMLRFRLALEQYISSDRSLPYLENVEVALLKLPSPLSSFDDGMQDKTAGTYLMPITSELIGQIYLLEDAPLTNLFQKHFPTPPVRLFNDLQIPHIVQRKSIEIDETMKKIDLKKIEPFIVKTQRHIRMKKRHQEEQNRIALREKHYLKFSHMSPEDLLQDANTPYKPRCASELSDRIMAAAKKVAAFSTVKHITSVKAIQSIFDDALYGRRTLMDFYLGFDPASLHSCDILNGDANVACLGPQDIDPKAHGGIIIEFDLPKLIQNKPAAFYKQRDLEYGLDRIRQVQLGDETISFDHTGFVRCANPTSTYLKIIDGRWGGLKHIARAPKSSFISYNLEQIHEILTLNFFRFIDRMTDLHENIDQVYIDNFYKKVSQLTDEELVIFLTNLEKNITDTAEFNFYGAHQIDFATIINITARYKGYTLNIPKFINDLKQGNTHELRQSRIKIPELFGSYRFLDYLLLKIQHSDVRYYLDDLRKQCKTPSWVQYTPLLVPEEFELSWEIHSESNIHEQEPVVATSIEKETNATASFLESTHQIPTVIHEGTTEVVTDKQQDVVDTSQIAPNNGTSTNNITSILVDDNGTIHDPLLEVIAGESVQENAFNKAFQAHRVQFDTLIGGLEAFLSYCSSSHDHTVLLYQPFLQELKTDFYEIGQNFFSDIHNKDKEALKRSFEIFRSDCERLSQKAEKNFRHNTGIWSYVKPILTGFVGVVITIAATLLTLGIATYHVAKNDRLRTQYIDTFFKSESGAIRDAKNKWAQYAIKQKLFGDEALTNKGLVNEVQETINIVPHR